jgi:hypothetical protein
MPQKQRVVVALLALFVVWCALQSKWSSQRPLPNENTKTNAEQSGGVITTNQSENKITDWLLVLFNGLLVGSTVLLWRASEKQIWQARLESRRTRVHRAQDEMRIEEQINIARQSSNAAQKAAETLPIIEGAYVFPDILAESIASNLQNLGHPMVTNRVLRLEFQFKNFGKTPAILHHFQADLIHFDQGHMRSKDAEVRIAKKVVLGAGEAEQLQTEIGDFSKAEAASVMAGHTNLSFTGYVVYADVFGNKWGYSFDWQFSPTQGRLVPDNQPRKKLD